MKNIEYDIVIIGGGPAGMSAGLSARKNGIESILILERDDRLGGILNQCIHNGFGLHRFKEELTGNEYAQRYIDMIEENHIEYKLNTTVTNISKDKEITYTNSKDGVVKIKAKSIILAMGCRERARGNINLLGKRQAGVFTAGTVQELINIRGKLAGKNVIIIGSGDIGLIMARRMTLEGANVKLVAEIMPYSGGLKRNIVQCLDDFDIPLLLSHTVVEILGDERVEGVIIAQLDENRNIIESTKKYYECDTLLLSVGLIPENELSKGAGVEINSVTKGAFVDESLETNIDGIFACGNVLHVHDLVDFVSEEAEIAGKSSAKYVLEQDSKRTDEIEVIAGQGVRYVVPNKVSIDRLDDKLTLSFRVSDVYENKHVICQVDNTEIYNKKKRYLAPAEIEKITIDKSKLIENFDKNTKTITLKLEI